MDRHFAHRYYGISIQNTDYRKHKIIILVQYFQFRLELTSLDVRRLFSFLVSPLELSTSKNIIITNNGLHVTLYMIRKNAYGTKKPYAYEQKRNTILSEGLFSLLQKHVIYSVTGNFIRLLLLYSAIKIQNRLIGYFYFSEFLDIFR